MTYILGVRPPYTVEETLPYADSLLIAMQLSNFWRDIGRIGGSGRVYCPGKTWRVPGDRGRPRGRTDHA